MTFCDLLTAPCRASPCGHLSVSHENRQTITVNPSSPLHFASAGLFKSRRYPVLRAASDMMQGCAAVGYTGLPL